jgi:hypothetical protein
METTASHVSRKGAALTHRRRRMRGGRVNVLGVLLVLLFIGGAGWAWIFGPYFWDYQVMREATAAAAREWRTAESKDKGVIKLWRRVEKEEMTYIPETACSFQEEGTNRMIFCAWDVNVYYPGTEYYRTLSFSLDTTCDAEGDIEQG